MLILGVDTSTRTGSAALLRDTEVLAEVSGYEETPYSTRLFRDLETLQGLVPFGLGQIDLFAVAAGPGSFTGLRVGLTAVKAWAEVHRKPIAAISGLEAIASEAVRGTGGPKSPPRATVVAPFLDARRGQIFGAVYEVGNGNGPSLSLVHEGSIVSPDEFLNFVKAASAGVPLLASPTPDAVSAGRLEEAFPGACVLSVSPALAPAIGRLGFERAKRGEVVDALRLDANYVRRSDAEAAWKDEA